MSDPSQVKLTPQETKSIEGEVKNKLSEMMGSYSDDVLPEYIMVMVANQKTKTQITLDLEAFLGDNAAPFTRWLWQRLTDYASTKSADARPKTSDAHMEEEEGELPAETVMPTPAAPSGRQGRSRSRDERRERSRGHSRDQSRGHSRDAPRSSDVPRGRSREPRKDDTHKERERSRDESRQRKERREQEAKEAARRERDREAERVRQERERQEMERQEMERQKQEAEEQRRQQEIEQQERLEQQRRAQQEAADRRAQEEQSMQGMDTEEVGEEDPMYAQIQQEKEERQRDWELWKARQPNAAAATADSRPARPPAAAHGAGHVLLASAMRQATEDAEAMQADATVEPAVELAVPSTTPQPVAPAPVQVGAGQQLISVPAGATVVVQQQGQQLPSPGVAMPTFPANAAAQAASTPTVFTVTLEGKQKVGLVQPSVGLMQPDHLVFSAGTPAPPVYGQGQQSPYRYKGGRGRGKGYFGRPHFGRPNIPYFAGGKGKGKGGKGFQVRGPNMKPAPFKFKGPARDAGWNKWLSKEVRLNGALMSR